MNRRFASSCFLFVAALLPAQTFDELYQSAQASARANQPAVALPIVERAIAKDGSRWEGHYLRGSVLLALGRPADALASAQLAASGAPAEQVGLVTSLVDRCRAAIPAPAPDRAKGPTAQPPGAVPAANLRVPDTRITTTIGLVMLPVLAQTFTMGSPASDRDRDNPEPQHRVTLTKNFWLAETEVTQRQWREVMGTQPWQGQSGTLLGDDVAATFVHWQDAVEFCTKLTERERAAGRLPVGHAYRLPTEAEWELAARAGSTTSYCFGDDVAQLRDYAVYAGHRQGEHAHAVKSRRANALGFYDLHGNVWEWCADLVAAGTGAKSDACFDGAVDPLGKSGSQRATRGGGWFYSADHCRSAHRSGSEPGLRYGHLGFRPALAAGS
ncbi:MAG: formylglycine-generating enzyme family protein [Planctomycetes bacterium]|nr:formylglycine-generating enzyme family protein [Planctomycetota bacterium]